jgi:hypothetical protein
MKKTTLLGLFLTMAIGVIAGEEKPVSLAGSWRFALDRSDAGVSERWFEHSLPDRIKLPGGLTEQGIGDPPSLSTPWVGGVQKPNWYLDPSLAPYSTPENFKFPYWLTPELYYAGAAWFQRDIEIPASWVNRRAVLTLERPHWETRVWLDGQLIGTNNSLGTPHMHDLGSVAPGRHVLSIRVDNRMVVDVGENSHSVSDHTQGNWNGIVGRIELSATPLVWVDALAAYPQVSARSVKVKGQIGNLTGKEGQGTLVVAARPVKAADGKTASKTVNVHWQPNGGSFEAELALGPDAQLWDEFNPALYRLSAELVSSERQSHRLETQFGLREIGTQRTQFTINGRKLFFRGTLECSVFPKTGHPPTDEESWERIMKTCRAHGLNMLRFHSWCPPEAAFNVADRLGFFLHVECCSWANSTTTLGDGKPVDAWLYAEGDRILKHYGNHPSFVLMLYGNEPGGPNHRKYLETWVASFKQKDNRRLYSSGAGWPQIEQNDFHVTPDPRVQAWGQGLKSRINAAPPETTTDYRDYISKRDVPVISHEIGQWCVYPNFDEMRKYRGYLKARNFEIFKDSLKANQMGSLAGRFLSASGKLQALCYKEDIESALRTPGMGGFQLLDLHDFPGQGTALVGVLDPFWEEKGYISPEEYRRFCNSTVPLARMAKRVFTTEEQLNADLEVAHFGPTPLKARATWKLVDGRGKTVANGSTTEREVPVDNAVSLGRLTVPLRDLVVPQKFRLVVALEGSNRKAQFENDWDIWVYPATVNSNAGEDIAIVDDLTPSALAKLERGGKVLLTIPPGRVRNVSTNKVALGFSSIFWNTAWTRRQPPTTLGILCDPKHPALAEFPTEYHSNWQWWHLVTRAGAMILDDLPPQLDPTVRVIDDWVTNHRLALLFEGKVGKGKLMVCSIDLEDELDLDPVRRQFRQSVLQYMGSRRFAPRTELSAEQVRGLITPLAEVKLPAVRAIKASSEESGYEAAVAFDMDPNTFWHTAWTPEPARYPHELKLTFKEARSFAGITLLPRQDGNRNGWIKDFEVYVSADGKSWGQPAAKGSLGQDAKLKTIKFEKPANARFLRLVALSGFGKDNYASLAELSLIETNSAALMRDDRGIPVRQVRGGIFATNTRGNVSVTVDGRSDGLRFDGIGAVSAGGSSRLLIDYPEPERSQILDYLFKPNYGAALQILKVEIGADADSTCGAEPSHERERGVVECGRGYEWWLMKEAKARNPELQLAALAWGAPGWISNFWSAANIRYTLSWLECARRHGLKIDYLGGGNERGWDADYYIQLKAALKTHGFGHIQVVASDDHNPPNYWAIADEMKKKPAFADAVDIIGQHDVCGWRTAQKHCNVSTAALELGKPLWDSENSTQDYRTGAEPLARVMTRHYLDAGITANFNWALAAAFYENFPVAATGLILADRPWSGFYDLGKSVWVDAHLTQFTRPGWRYLDSACGYTPHGASLVALRSPNSDDYTIYIETVDLTEPETLEFSLAGGLSTNSVVLWRTQLGTTDDSSSFVLLDRVQPKDGRYHLRIEPGHVYTCSTTTGQRKGNAQPRAPRDNRLVLPFSEDFDSVQPGEMARYFADVHGAFEAALTGGGRKGKVYRQVVKQEPLLWHRAKMPPTTIVGDPRWEGDYEVKVDVLLESKGYAGVVGRIESQQHSVAGYHFQISHTGAWRVFTQNVSGDDRVLASGTNNSVKINQWHTIGMRFQGDGITASLDGSALSTIHDQSHKKGQVGLRSSPWVQAQFDNLRVTPIGPAQGLANGSAN